MKATLKKLFSGGMVKWIMYLLLIIILLFAGRYIYLKIRYPENNVLHGVPGNAIMVVEGTGFLDFAEMLTESPVWYSGFKQAQQPDHLKTITDELRIATESEDGPPISLLNEQPFCAALIPRKAEGPGLLVVLQLNRGVSPASIHNSLFKLWPSYKEKRLLEINYHERVLQNGDALFIAVKDGLVIASCDREVFELAYYTVESGNNIMKDGGFISAFHQLSKSQNRAPRLYMSHEGLYGWFARFLVEDARDLIATIPETGSWSALELAVADKGLHMQGFTHLPEIVPSLAESMKTGGSILEDPGKVLPFNTLFYDQMATDGFDNFFNKYIKGYLEKYKGAVADYPFPSSTLDSLRTVITRMYVQSITTAVTDRRDTTVENNYLLLIHAGRINGTEQAMLSFADSLKGFNYQGYPVYPFFARNIIPALFGERYRAFEDAFYTVYQDYLIISPDRELMMATINAVMLNRTLSVFPGYSESIGKVNPELSQRYYFNSANSDSHLMSKINPVNRDGFDRFRPYMPQQLLVSFLKEQDVILTDIVVVSGYGESSVQGEQEIILDDIPSTPPVLMKDHRNSEIKVFLADLSGFLYLINKRGGIEWKTEPIEPALSSLEVIDLYKNGRHQCLFLSRNMLHIFQADGKYVNGYPVKLPSGFNSSLSVFDYENNGNYRIIYVDVNGRLTNIDIGGRRVAGWVTPVAGSVCRPLSYHKIAGMDFLIATDSSGYNRFFDRRGNERFSSGSSCLISPESGIAETYSVGVPYLSFIDREGNICQVSSGGAISKHETIKFTGDPIMLEIKNTQDNKSYLVIAEPGLISVYDNELKMVTLIQLQTFSAVSLQAVPGDRMFLCSGIDNQGVPFLISYKEYKIIRFTDKNYDGILVWKDNNAEITNVLKYKGSMVQTGNL